MRTTITILVLCFVITGCGCGEVNPSYAASAARVEETQSAASKKLAEFTKSFHAAQQVAAAEHAAMSSEASLASELKTKLKELESKLEELESKLDTSEKVSE